MKKTIRAKSGHTMCVVSADRELLPANLAHSDRYTKFYVVRNWDAGGHIFLYLAKGNPDAPNQVVAWYPATKAFWSSFGLNLESAINGAITDGWMYA